MYSYTATMRVGEGVSSENEFIVEMDLWDTITGKQYRDEKSSKLIRVSIIVNSRICQHQAGLIRKYGKLNPFPPLFSLLT